MFSRSYVEEATSYAWQSGIIMNLELLCVLCEVTVCICKG